MDYLVIPELKLSIAGKEYPLSPATECLKKIQHHFKKDIIEVMLECPRLKFDDHAKIIEISIEDTGAKPPELQAIEQWIVDDVGIASIRNIMQGWLAIIVSPKAEREAVTKTVTKTIALVERAVVPMLHGSLGELIKKCVSDTSDGSLEISGEPQSGK